MDAERDAFYLVRKGDVIGLYKNLSDFQHQLGHSVCDPPISVFKGYGLSKEAEEYLVSHGLTGAACSIGATGLRDDLFGHLVACPFQQPVASNGTAVQKVPQKKRPPNMRESDDIKEVGTSSSMGIAQRKLVKLDNYTGTPEVPSNCVSCIIEFDGASKGNPGLAGAGVIVRAENGSVVCRLREGLGIATNNVAEYRALILGLKYAVKKGFKHIRVRGDSKLVCMQVQGLWKTKNQNMADLCDVAKELKDKFTSFQIQHIEREFNSEADTQANYAVTLKSGDVQEECVNK